MARVTSRTFHRWARGALVYTVAVILWGAYVRATSSGDGCGSHWPTCHGAVVPRDPTVETLVELTHRVTSGLAWLVALGLVVAAWRVFPKRHRVRRAAAAVGVLMTTEALIGAGVVLLRMVGDNASMARAGWMAGHLINTFLLVGAMTATVRWSDPAAKESAPGIGSPPHRVLPLACLLGVLVVGMGGAVSALGDTLFPASSLREALRQDLSPAAHVFIRLRVFHPLLAMGTGALVLFTAGQVLATRNESDVRRPAVAAAALYVAQLALGVVNVLLLAPVWMQVVHLLFAHMTWIALVWLADATGALSAPRGSTARLPATGAPSADVPPSGPPGPVPRARQPARR